MNIVTRPISAAIAALFAAAPLVADAQSPTYAQAENETIHGTIASVQNVNHIFVNDDRGFVDNVTIADGADVLSNGARLEPGRRITVVGHNGGRTFVASSISTQQRVAYRDDTDESTRVTASAPAYVPTPVYYPAYYPVYYPAYAFAFGYGFGRPYGYRPYRSSFGIRVRFR